MQAIPREMHDPHKQWSINTAKETLMSQDLPVHSREGKVREGHPAHDVMDKDQISGKKFSSANSTQVLCNKYTQ